MTNTGTQPPVYDRWLETLDIPIYSEYFAEGAYTDRDPKWPYTGDDE